jgi:hypothetical protein
MTDANKRFDRAVSTLSRRRALIGGATLLTAGGSLVWVGDPVHAAVSVDDLAIPDASFTSRQVAPVVDVTLGFDYDVGMASIKHLALGLSVGGETIASDELVTDKTTYNGQTTLSGRVTDASAWASGDFAPAVGERVERTLTVGVTFAVVNTSDETIVEDSTTTDVVVGVSHPQESRYTASVGGTGTVRNGTTQ